MNDAFPSKYLNAADLQGQEIPAVIERVDSEVMRDGTAKLVAYFRGKKKGLALNKTNASRIAAKYGDESDDWEGASLVLYPDVTNFGNEVRDCIRVRMTTPKAAPKKAAPPVESDEPPMPDDGDTPF